MDKNDVTNTSEKKSLFTVKIILRALSVLCIIFVFCPSFLVSCSGHSINVNVMTAVIGIYAFGEIFIDLRAIIIMLICLLIPVVVLILLFVKKYADKKKAVIIVGCIVVDLVSWFLFRAAVKKMAEEIFCLFRTTGWFVINVIVMILIILLSALVVLSKMEMDTDLIIVLTGGRTQGTLNQMSTTVNQLSNAVNQLAENAAENTNSKTQKENAIGLCLNCGIPITYGCKFCTSCGTPEPESMLAEAAKTEQVLQIYSERPISCQQCSTKLEADAVFCESCGTKVE